MPFNLKPCFVSEALRHTPHYHMEKEIAQILKDSGMSTDKDVAAVRGGASFFTLALEILIAPPGFKV